MPACTASTRAKDPVGPLLPTLLPDTSGLESEAMGIKDSNVAIVVGIDDVPDNADSLTWAVAEAEATGRPLRLVHAFEWLAEQAPYYAPVKNEHPDAGIRAEFTQRAHEIAHHATEFVNALDANVSMSSRVIEGTPSTVLTEEGRDAAMLVLGSHARGLAGRLLMGSVSSAVAADPPCPVTVVRNGIVHPVDDPTLPIVVGVDRSPSSRAALRFAADHAAAHKSHLIIVHSWHHYPRRTAGTVAEQADHRDEWVRGVIDAVHQEHPSLDITRAVTETGPKLSLVDWSERARLVVVGTSEHHKHLGSVAQALLHHAWSPVTVVPSTSE